MKTNLPVKFLLGVSVGLLAAFHSFVAIAQDSPKAAGGAAPASSAAPAKPKLSQEEMEAKFKATLTQATMAGRWCGVKDGKLTPEKEDKYTIVSVNKLGGEAWIINARIQYGNKDFVAPIPILVKWAGDTPVITVDNVGMPGGGNSYSARVLVYDKTYAGTWSGGDHLGLLSGVITKATDAPASNKE
jgi:hypothetical protein